MESRGEKHFAIECESRSPSHLIKPKSYHVVSIRRCETTCFIPIVPSLMSSWLPFSPSSSVSHRFVGGMVTCLAALAPLLPRSGKREKAPTARKSLAAHAGSVDVGRKRRADLFFFSSFVRLSLFASVPPRASERHSAAWLRGRRASARRLRRIGRRLRMMQRLRWHKPRPG